MRREFSPAAQRLLDSLQIEGNPTLAQALTLLLDDDEGQPAQLLAQHHVPTQELIAETRDAETLIDIDQLTHDAVRIAHRNNSADIITTEHFLLALIEEQIASAELSHDRIAMLQGILNDRTPPRIDHQQAEMDAVAFMIDDPMSLAETQRIIDVNLNRAFESLRVLDDYCRFVLNDRHWTESIKQLRHGLATIIAQTPTVQGNLARDTAHDVGTDIQGQHEATRRSPTHVAAINFRRLQESLRSLEEYGKILDAYFARRIERLRYDSYILESGLAIAMNRPRRLTAVQICLLISAKQCHASMEWTVEQAIKGGVGMVQLREKEIDDRTLLDRAKRLRSVTRDHNTHFIVNDRPDIARLVDADGVHLGQDDLPINKVRSILGVGKLVGLSTHSPEQLQAALNVGADYLGVGPMFPSKTKPFPSRPGLVFLRHAVDETTTPAFAIGGINTSNIAEIAASGCRRIAVSDVICQADEPEQVARTLIAALNTNEPSL